MDLRLLLPIKKEVEKRTQERIDNGDTREHWVIAREEGAHLNVEMNEKR